METIRLVLAESNFALRRVLETGFTLYGFEVLTVPSVSAAAKATAQEDVHAVLLDAGLIGSRLPELDPAVTVVVMADEAPADGVSLWIRKPFSPKMLAAFLLRRYKRIIVAHNRRESYRRASSGTAELVFDGMTELCQAQILNVSEGGCALALAQPCVASDRLRMLLRYEGKERLCEGMVKNARLALTTEGELRLAVGVEIVRSGLIG